MMIKVKMIKIVIDALGMVLKSLVKELEVLEIGGRAKTIQNTVLLRSKRILRRVLETFYQTDSSEKLAS